MLAAAAHHRTAAHTHTSSSSRSSSSRVPTPSSPACLPPPWGGAVHTAGARSGGCAAAAAAAAGGKGSGSSSDRFIAPVDPSAAAGGSNVSSSSFLLGDGSSIASAPAAGPAARSAAAHDARRGRRRAQQQQQQAPSQRRNSSQRGSLISSRVAPRRARLRRSFDEPRRQHLSPSDPAFGGQLATLIGSAYGPRTVGKLVQDFAPHFSPRHAAAAIAALAGMATGKQLPPQLLADDYKAPATRAAAALAPKVGSATVLECARAVYGLARLQVYEPQLLAAVEQHTRGQLGTATPQALAGLAVGLAHWGHQPSPEWVQELCVAAFASMPTWSAQELANLVFSLSCWQMAVSQPFLLRCLTAFRGHWGTAGCHAPALVRFVFALTQLPPCQPLPPAWQAQQPEGAPVYCHHEQYRQQRELQAMSAAMGLPQQQQQQQRASDGSSSSSSSSSAGPAPLPAVATYRLPSFNWLTAFLGECRRQIDRCTPAELATLLWCMAALNHTPDLIFMQAWFRAAAVTMHAFTPASLAVALQALGLLQPGRDVPGASLSGRWTSLALQHSQQMLVAAAAAAHERQPHTSSSGPDTADGRGVCQAGDLSKMLWGLAELRVWPGRPWMQVWLSAAGPLLPSAAPADLADIVWALARLRFAPDEAWMQQLAGAIDGVLPALSVQELAAVVWGYSRLGLKPGRAWLLRFRALAAEPAASALPASSSASAAAPAPRGGAASGQRLAQFVAAVLAQQNRARFARASRAATESRRVG